MPANEAAKDKSKKFGLFFEENPQAMWVFDAESLRILDANAAAAMLYGYSRDEFRSLTLLDLQGPEEAHRFSEELKKSIPVATIWRYRIKGGRAIEVETTLYPTQYQRRKAYLAILIDVTGRRQLEEQLRQAQKMEAVGMLAGGVAHDFNNLLTIITGYSQLILNNLPAEDPNRHSAEQILKAGERAAGLTKQLLAFSRRQVLQPKVLDVNELVSGLTTMLRRLIGEDIELRLVLHSELGRVSADPGQVEQMLMNLVVNARDAMPKGGVLTIETRNVELDENYSGRHLASKPGRHVLLAVSDTGHGMDESTRARLFEPFFTTKSMGKGTGLGLSTVFGIVKQSGGSIEVYSEPAKGTSVKIFLPRIDQPVPVQPEEAKKRSRTATETIMLVEDDEMVRSLVRETLQREGYKVIEAADPVDARRVAGQYTGPIHLLITDVVMPKLSGRELSEALVAKRPELKVLYMSGYTDSAVVNSGVLEKEVAFLQKPFLPAALTDKVREVLDTNGKTCRSAS